MIGYPSTLVFNRYGFLFDSCNFTAEAGASGVLLAASGWSRATRWRRAACRWER